MRRRRLGPRCCCSIYASPGANSRHAWQDFQGAKIQTRPREQAEPEGGQSSGDENTGYIPCSVLKCIVLDSPRSLISSITCLPALLRLYITSVCRFFF